MTNNQNFRIQFPENVDNEISIAFELLTPSKNATATTGRPTLSKSSMNHSQADNVNK